MLLDLQAPRADSRQGSSTEVATGILQMLIAAEDFLPLSAVILNNGDPRDERARNHSLRCCFQAIDDERLRMAVLGQIAEEPELRRSEPRSLSAAFGRRRESAGAAGAAAACVFSEEEGVRIAATHASRIAS